MPASISHSGEDPGVSSTVSGIARREDALLEKFPTYFEAWASFNDMERMAKRGKEAQVGRG